MRYGHAAEIAIRVTLYLATRPFGEISPIRKVATAAQLPAPYLSKVTQRLAPVGLVRAFRGPGGGIALGKPPEAITLWSLVAAVEGRALSDRCALGIGQCSPKNPCPFHDRWAAVAAESRRVLEETTIADLIRQLNQGPGRYGESWRTGFAGPSAFTTSSEEEPI